MFGNALREFFGWQIAMKQIAIKIIEMITKGNVIEAGIAINGITIAITLPFFLYPRTASIRALGWSGAVFALAILGACVGLKRSWGHLRTGRLSLGFFGLILALSPLPIAIFLFHLAAYVKGYELAP